MGDRIGDRVVGRDWCQDDLYAYWSVESRIGS